MIMDIITILGTIITDIIQTDIQTDFLITSHPHGEIPEAIQDLQPTIIM
jgi:hypothetical protein